MGYKGKSSKSSFWGKWADAWSGNDNAWSSADWSGKGKWSGKEQVGETTESATGRIWARHQFSKIILRPSAGPAGSAFQNVDYAAPSKKNMADDVFLGPKNLKALLTPDVSHLLRRPGVGLSEIAGSVQAGIDVLGQLENAGFADIRDLFAAGGDGLAKAWKTLNTEGKEQREAADVEEAFGVVFNFLTDNRDTLRDLVVKATIASARAYLMGASLLQLQAAVDDPEWWAEKVPTSTSECPELELWQKKPKDARRLAKAMGALVEEKVRERADGHDNTAASIFTKKRKEREAPVDGKGDEDEPHKEASKKDSKKAGSKKEKKAKKDSSSDSTTSDGKKAEKRAKKAAKKKAKKDAEELRKREQKQAEEKAVAFTTWPHGDAQTTMAAAETMIAAIGRTPGGVFPAKSLVELVATVPAGVLAVFSEICDAMNDWEADAMVANGDARVFAKSVLAMAEDADDMWTKQPSDAAGSSK